jgi:hypothetical protein
VRALARERVAGGARHRAQRAARGATPAFRALRGGEEAVRAPLAPRASCRRARAGEFLPTVARGDALLALRGAGVHFEPAAAARRAAAVGVRLVPGAALRRVLRPGAFRCVASGGAAPRPGCGLHSPGGARLAPPVTLRGALGPRHELLARGARACARRARRSGVEGFVPKVPLSARAAHIICRG